ncbi:MAG: lamin tail domain-containing protein, partial [Ginsengibacter sp.]
MKKTFTLLLSFICFSGMGQTHLVISQVYGGGGNSSASYTNDFIELYNPTSAAINVKDYSVQYASSTGTSWTSTTVLPDKDIQPGNYFLIQEASGGAVGAAMPTPDATGTINLSASKGKVILVSIATASTGSCPTTNVIDKVGYGAADCFEGTAPAAGPSDNIKSVMRNSTNDDNDQNSTDFTNSNNAVPRNSNFNALPISLNKFLVAKMGNGYAVSWQVTCLSNSVNFQIERSSLSNSGFNSFYSATESKARCASSFTVNDEQPFAGKPYYRLKITNVDGAVNYSKTVLVQNGSIRNAI